MSGKKERALGASLAALLLLPAFLWAGHGEDLHHEFVREGNSYSFRGRFMLPGEAACLMDVIFQYEHITEYACGAKSVELIREGEGWNEVAYTYRRMLVFENRSTWRRVLDRDRRKVEFEMLKSQNNLDILPKVLSSRGHYEVRRDGEGFWVEYFQECRLEESIWMDRYMARAKKEAFGFLEEFRDYAARVCGHAE